MVLYLDRMCQYELQAVLWLHIVILMRHLDAGPRNTAGLLFSCQCLCGMILATLISTVWDGRVFRVGSMLFYWPILISPFLSSTVFPFSSFFL